MKYYLHWCYHDSSSPKLCLDYKQRKFYFKLDPRGLSEISKELQSAKSLNFQYFLEQWNLSPCLSWSRICLLRNCQKKKKKKPLKTHKLWRSIPQRPILISFSKIQRFFEAKCEVKNFQNIAMSYGDVGSYIILQMLMIYTSIKKVLR